MPGSKWNKVENCDELKKECSGIDMDYYQWKLVELSDQVAHVIAVKVKNQNELSNCWKLVVDNVAVYVQSELEDELERSNLYICYFVNEDIDNDLIEKIENDQYSSKKYVFSGIGIIDENSILDIMAKKIFVFSYQSEDLKAIGKIRKINIQNFRSYYGPREFNLEDKNGKGAQLVVVFAPNGYGKTSFFDAIEWNLTGKIDRLDKLRKNRIKFEGRLIANTKGDEKQDAFVDIFVDNGDRIKSVVQKINVKNRKQDYDRGVPAKTENRNSDKYLSFNNWKDLILPHHKIDSFIGVTTPEKRYEEWGSFWDISGQNTNMYEEAYAEYEKQLKNVEKIAGSLGEKKSNCDKLASKKTYLDEFKDKIKNYNGIQYAKKIELPNVLDEVGYKKIIDEILQYESEYKEYNQNKKNVLFYIENKLDEDLKALNGNKKSVEDIKKRYERVVAQEKEAFEKIDIKRKYEKLKKEKEECLNEINTYSKILYLGEKWFEQAFEYKKANELLNQYSHNKSELSDQVNKCKNEVQQSENQIKVIEIELKNENEYKLLKENYERIIYIKNFENKIIQEIKMNESYVSELSEKSKELRTSIENKKRLIIQDVDSLLENILEYKVVVQEESDDFKDELELLIHSTDTYFELEHRYNQANKQVVLEEKTDEKVQKILLECRQIIEKRKLKCCPVCNTKFDNYKELLQVKINDNEGKITELQKIADEIRKEFENKKKGIMEKIQKCNDIVMKVISEKTKILVGKELVLNNTRSKIQELKKQLEDLKEQLEAILKEDIQKGRAIEYTEECLKEWHNNWKKLKVENLKEEYAKKIEREKSLNALSNTLKTLEALEKEYEQVILKLQEDKKFLENYSKYKVYMDRDYWEIEKQNSSLLEKRKNLENYMSNIENLLCKYKDIDETKSFQAEKESLLLEEESKIKIMYSLMKIICNNVEVDNIEQIEAEKIANEIKEKIAIYSKIIEALQTLKYNQEINSYLKEFQDAKQEVKSLEMDYNDEKEKLEDLNKNYEEKKQILKEGFEKFFNEFHVSDIYGKIEPHKELNKIECDFEINKGKPELNIVVVTKDGKRYVPELYFSTAQLNVVAFSLFLGRALYVQKSMLKSVFIDDPIGHFDDMNIVAFVDLLRNLVTNTDRQFIVSTHEERVYNLIKRKIPDGVYSACYFDLRDF